MNQYFDGEDAKELDHTHIRGTNCIDSITATSNVINHAEGSRIFEASETVKTDHRACVVEMNLEEIF